MKILAFLLFKCKQFIDLGTYLEGEVRLDRWWSDSAPNNFSVKWLSLKNNVAMLSTKHQLSTIWNAIWPYVMTKMFFIITWRSINKTCCDYWESEMGSNFNAITQKWSNSSLNVNSSVVNLDGRFLIQSDFPPLHVTKILFPLWKVKSK